MTTNEHDSSIERKESTPERFYEPELLNSLLNEESMVVMSSERVERVQYVETCETRRRGIKAGETEYYMDVPVRKPILSVQTETLEELKYTEKRGAAEAASYLEQWDAQEADSYAKYGVEHLRGIPSYEAWRESLSGAEPYYDTAEQYIEQRERSGQEVLLCRNCKGGKSFELTCMCTEGGVVYVGNDAEPTQSLRKKGEADPNCGTCEGEGRYVRDCMSCDGRGEMLQYPTVVFVNSETGVSVSVELDLWRMVAEHEVMIREEFYGTTYMKGADKVGERRLKIDITPFLHEQLGSIGIDVDSALNVTPYGVHAFDVDRFNQTIASDQWRQRDGEVTTSDSYGRQRSRSRTPQTPMSAVDRLKHAQTNIAGNFMQVDLEHPVVYELKNRKNFSQALSELIVEADKYDCVVGVTHSFIATGETGPSAYLLNKDYLVETQLSNDYSVEDCIENALENIRKITPKT